MSVDDARCEQSRASIATPTIISKETHEAEASTVDTACVPKIQRCSRKEVAVSQSRLKRSRQEVLDAKRARLRLLFERDAIEMENSLRDLGYAFIDTHL